ncbi:MAG: DedA family protein [Paludibacteraceae bacterium]|nr:DedA family protein [Paludibacteraceae bacterium]MBQ6764505.1 DedA family protein [Paludibacteraceae bacterium]
MSIIDQVVAWYSAHISHASVAALMAVESSFIPFPSEVVIPPAVYVAGNPDSALYVTGNYVADVLLIVLSGTIGAMIGAVVNYVLSVWLGRLIIYRFADSRLGHLCLLSGDKLQKAEEYFRSKGNVSTFVGRFIPGIRQLISIPAGLSRMHFGAFLWYTFLGAFVWNCILALLGYVAHGQMDLIEKYSHELSVAILLLLGAVIIYFAVRKVLSARKRQ